MTEAVQTNLFEDVFSDDIVVPGGKLPKGSYPVTLNKVVESENKGYQNLTFEFQVADTHPHAKRRIYIKLCVGTSNEKMQWLVKRDKGLLRSISEAMGYTKGNQPKSMDDLIDQQPIIADIGYDSNDYIKANYFKKCAENEGSEASAGEWTF